MSRRHEIWDVEGHADMLEAAWGPANNSRGRHWEALIAIRDLVRYNEILDVACGQGHFYGILKEPKPHYTGIDNSIDMLEKARKIFPDIAENFVIGDAYNIGNEVTPHDSVVMIDLLMHLPEIEVPIFQAWGKAGKELLIAHQIHRTKSLTQKVYSGPIVLPKEKILLNRYDTPSTMFSIFSGLNNLGSIEQFFFDSRTTIYRLTKGMTRYGGWRTGWPKT